MAIVGLCVNNLITINEAFQVSSTFATGTSHRHVAPLSRSVRPMFIDTSKRRKSNVENLSMHFGHGIVRHAAANPRRRRRNGSISSTTNVNGTNTSKKGSTSLRPTMSTVFGSTRRRTSWLCSSVDGVTILGMMVNALLSVSKAVVGVRCDSAVLLADAGHSLSDLLTDLLTLVFVRFGRYEAIGSLALSLVLVGAGVSVGAASARRLFSDATTTAVVATASRVPALVVAGLSVLSKEWLYRTTRRVGEKSGSPVVVANAWHHRSDALSSVLALVSVGLGAVAPSLRCLDAAAGLAVGAVVAKAGVDVASDSVRSLRARGNADDENSASSSPSSAERDDHVPMSDRDRASDVVVAAPRTDHQGETFVSPPDENATTDCSVDAYAVLKSLEESLALTVAATSSSSNKQMQVRAFVRSLEESLSAHDVPLAGSLPWLFDAQGNVVESNKHVTVTTDDRRTTVWSTSLFVPTEDTKN